MTLVEVLHQMTAWELQSVDTFPMTFELKDTICLAVIVPSAILLTFIHRARMRKAYNNGRLAAYERALREAEDYKGHYDAYGSIVGVLRWWVDFYRKN